VTAPEATPGSNVDADAFLAQRPRLMGVAYRILGSYADAEDVLQDAWLRWQNASRNAIDEPAAWLMTVVTRLSIDRLRRRERTRETYVGPWLPEPVLTAPDIAERVSEADTVSLAMLVVLETLTPLERAVFVLREVFGYDHGAIAEMLGRTEPAVRQLAKRARGHVDARTRRFDTDASLRRTVTERFLHACMNGDMAGLLAVLAPGVTLVSDSGGLGRAPRRVMSGADSIARFFLAVAQKPVPDQRLTLTEVNGTPGVVVYSGSVPVYAAVVETEDGRVVDIKMIANPEKLAGVAAPVPLQ
jgi:RNA polymerase sigma-70 factor (ECF subfamily)